MLPRARSAPSHLRMWHIGRLRLPTHAQASARARTWSRQLTGVAAERRHLYELAAELPRYGVSSRFYRKSWLRNGWDPANYYWTVTKIRLPQPPESALGMVRGRVWGTLVWNGVAHGRTMLVRAALPAVQQCSPPPCVPPSGAGAEGEQARLGHRPKCYTAAAVARCAGARWHHQPEHQAARRSWRQVACPGACGK